MAAALGVPVPFEFEGKELSVSAVDVDIVGAFETWLEGRALAAVQRHAPTPGNPDRASPGTLSPLEYQASLEVWQRDCAVGLYEWEGPAAVSARYSAAGQKYLAYLQLARRGKDVTLKLVDRVWADRDALARLRGALQQAGRDPNPPGPGPGAAPPPG